MQKIFTYIYVTMIKKWKQNWKLQKISKKCKKYNKPLEQGWNLNIHYTTDGESN